MATIAAAQAANATGSRDGRRDGPRVKTKMLKDATTAVLRKA
jgi:hypothetical protein